MNQNLNSISLLPDRISVHALAREKVFAELECSFAHQQALLRAVNSALESEEQSVAIGIDELNRLTWRLIAPDDWRTDFCDLESLSEWLGLEL